MDINERAEKLVNAMLQGQNDFISASNKQQEELSEAKNSNMKELMEIYDKGYNDAVEKACEWLKYNAWSFAHTSDGFPVYDTEMAIEAFEQAMEE